MTSLKARAFHPAGEATPRGSQVDRAEATSHNSSVDCRRGSHALQLKSTHPSSAFVTTTTFSASSAACSRTSLTSSASASRASATAPSGGAPRTERPCCRMQVVDGQSVSSQSKMITVWFGKWYSLLLSVDLHDNGVMSSEILRSASPKRGEASSNSSSPVSISRYGRGKCNFGSPSVSSARTSPSCCLASSMVGSSGGGDASGNLVLPAEDAFSCEVSSAASPCNAIPRS
mmetsp:Transcript_106823/g.300307  ORF Transcript_106823/g.300307 Transcript_106823/m.300307 type:complete len:231 (-) Transcript_106823:83-775(-)